MNFFFRTFYSLLKTCLKFWKEGNTVERLRILETNFLKMSNFLLKSIKSILCDYRELKKKKTSKMFLLSLCVFRRKKKSYSRVFSDKQNTKLFFELCKNGNEIWENILIKFNVKMKLTFADLIGYTILVRFLLYLSLAREN